MLPTGEVIFALDGSRNVGPGTHIELAEHVADVRLDRLLAEEQLAGDLTVRLAVNDQPGDLELALRQGRDSGLVGVAGSGAPVDVLAESPKFSLCGVAVATGATAFELGDSCL